LVNRPGLKRHTAQQVPEDKECVADPKDRNRLLPMVSLVSVQHGGVWANRK
jgi:hypothetical protein